jgi:Ulp1 family protease
VQSAGAAPADPNYVDLTLDEDMPTAVIQQQIVNFILVEDQTEEEKAAPAAFFFTKWDTMPMSWRALRETRSPTWFTCEIINLFFMVLRLAGEAALAAAIAGGAANGVAAGACFAFNSFFFAKMTGQTGVAAYDFKAVSGWTAVRGKRPAIDIFAYRHVILPINIVDSHWLLGWIDNLECTVMTLDSFGPNDVALAEHLLRYVGDEHAAKKGAPPPTPYRIVQQPADLPRQGNVFDCGPFTSAFGECIARGLRPSSALFSQSDMVFWRDRVAATCLFGAFGLKPQLPLQAGGMAEE